MRILQPTSPEEHRRALALLIARPDITSQQIEAQLDALGVYASSYGLSLRHCAVAMESDRPIAACLCVDSPGRIASVFLPAALDLPQQREACGLLLADLAGRAAARGVCLLQAMLDPESTAEAGILRQSGYGRAARLLFLERDLALPLPRADRTAELRWEPYSEREHGRFLSVLQATYEASLDCPALNGRRSMDDVLATHRAAGRFDPASWLLACRADRPVGLVLVNTFPERLASEVVYMGLLTAFRHRGYGRALLRQAVALARDHGSLTLALSVDEDNAPARRLYESFGFQPAATRDAWIQFLDAGSSTEH